MAKAHVGQWCAVVAAAPALYCTASVAWWFYVFMWYGRHPLTNDWADVWWLIEDGSAFAIPLLNGRLDHPWEVSSITAPNGIQAAIWAVLAAIGWVCAWAFSSRPSEGDKVEA